MIRIRVPATSANLGPGFDILALALDLCNEVIVEPTDDRSIMIDLGPDADDRRRDTSRNLIVLSYHARCDELSVPDDSRGIRFRCVNRIPQSRGLGSSAAAIVSGVLAAECLHGAERDRGGRATFNVQSSKVESEPSSGDGGRLHWDARAVLDSAARIEGHPENVAAAVLGGLVICARDCAVKHVEIGPDLACVLFVPHDESSTKAARASVPAQFSRSDAVFNASRCALLVRAIALHDYESLAVAMQDRWHQPYRAAQFPAFESLVEGAIRTGAYGAALSGAGSSVIALADPARQDEVAIAMTDAARTVNVAGETMVLAPRNTGAEVERNP